MLKIVNVPHPVLSSPTKPVDKIDDGIEKLVYDMEDTLIAQSDPQGVGLAANQVGVGLSIFIIKKNPKTDTKVFINPKVLEIANNQPKKTRKNGHGDKLEGCLSIPRIWGPVKRSNRVHLEYQDLDGRKHKKWFKGFEAVIIQHEVDHLHGIVFTQRSLEQEGSLYKEVNGKLKPFEL